MNRFGGVGSYDPEAMRAALSKKGMGLTSTPVAPPVEIPVAPPTPVRSVPIAPTEPAAEPFRMPDPAAVEAWRSGANQDIASGVTTIPVAEPPARVPSAFPAGGTAPIIATNPVVEQAPGGGISLNSNPVAPGWAGTVGIPTTPEESKWWEKGMKNAELMSGLEQLSKGLKPKAQGDSGANTITPMSVQPNQPGQLSGELMGQILQGRRRKYGISLAG